MPVKIGDMCISCGACAEECPAGAVSEGPEVFVVDASRCFECVGLSGEFLCAPVCPVQAIVPDEGAAETEARLLAKAASILPADRKIPALEALTEATSRFRK